MKKLTFILTPVLVAFLVGCSEAPKTDAKKEAAKPAQPVTGQSALFKMFQVARAWSGDVEVLEMHSIFLTEVPQVPGKAGAWQATFGSRAKSSKKSWTFSVIEAQGNLHEGVFGGSEESWTPSAVQPPPFLIGAVKKDTDEAYQTAKTKAGEAAKKLEDKPISFVLATDKKHPNPFWRVMWGESVGTASLSVFVDATTGEYLETLH